MIQRLSIGLLILFFIVPSLSKENKYTKEANLIYKEIENPFRMEKMNLVWRKAIKNLSEQKLKSLYTDLQLQDKEELKLKRLKADGLDKDGHMEATVRRKFKDILTSFALLQHFGQDESEDEKLANQKKNQHSENHINKSLFKDKKLNKLWEKAEKSGGFTQEELKVLKEEFVHHQEKIDEYHLFVEDINKGDKEDNKFENHIDFENILEESDDPLSKNKKMETKDNQLKKEKKHEIKENYEQLVKRASGPRTLEFSEPKVISLWKTAQNSDFTPDELTSLYEELKHYERRLEKLQHLQGELLVKNTHQKKLQHHTDKDTESIYLDKIKRQERTVEKLHSQLESRILGRHVEL